MNVIKFILAVLGAVFAGLIILSLLGWLGTLIWYLFWIGVLGAIGYGGYKLFKKAEAKALGSDPYAGLGTSDINMSWDEYDRKYLHK
jgi:hypothetical protein